MKSFFTINLILFSLILPVWGEAQLVLVTGTVVNEKTGAAILNANILESISGIGTISNANGFFSLMLSPGKTELVFSYDGFNSVKQNLVLKKDTTLSVSMVPLVNKVKKETEQQKTAEKVEKNR